MLKGGLARAAAVLAGAVIFLSTVGSPAAAPTVGGPASAPAARSLTIGGGSAILGSATGSTSEQMLRAMAGRYYPFQVRPLVGRAAHQYVRGAARGAISHAAAKSGLVINVPLGGDVAAAAGAVDEAGGGVVQLAAGTYHLTSSIPLLSNITIQGQGSSTIIQSPQTPHGFPMIANVSEGISNITIQNLVLDGNIPTGSFGTGVYNGAGIYIVALNNAINFVNINNVEVEHTSIGLLLDGVNNISVNGSYVHNNNPGFFSHNAYFVGCSGVTVSHSRFDNAWLGDGLHFDFGSSVYTISKSEFNGNNGEGILDQGGSNEQVTDTTANGNRNDGFNMSSNSSGYQRLEANNNWGFGYNNGGGSGGAFSLVAFGDAGGFGQFFGYGFGALLNSTTANQYLAILAQGALGPADTADFSTAYSGYSTIGEVDFNARHIGNGGVLTFNVGAVGKNNYSASVRYSNGTTSTLAMSLLINGASIGRISFPPTGAWTTWSTASVTLPLNDGNNTVSVQPVAPAAPELDYLRVSAPVPAAPAAPAGLTATPRGPYANYLSWNRVPGAQSYTVYRAGVPVALATNITATNFTDSTLLSPATTNTYVVAANNQGGGSPGTSVKVTSPLDGPLGLQVAVANPPPGYILTWTDVSGATSYVIKRSTDTGGPYTTIGTVAGTATGYVDTTAVSGTVYYYAVASANASSQSANSYELSVAAPTSGQLSQDIGATGLNGITDYNPTNKSFALFGSGAGAWSTADAFHYEYLPVTGNVTMTARVVSVQALALATQVGIDIRSSLSPGAPNVLVGISGGLGAIVLTRPTNGSATQVTGRVPGITAPYYVQLARNGQVFTSAISKDGITWTNISSVTLAGMPAGTFIGLAVSSTVLGKEALGQFDTVTTTGTILPTTQASPLSGRANLQSNWVHT